MMLFFFFKQKTAYEMRISDWSSDVCSSDLLGVNRNPPAPTKKAQVIYGNQSVRSVSRLKPATSGPSQASGLFNLPGSQDLVSAWMHAAINRQLDQVSSARYSSPDEPDSAMAAE